MVTVERLYRSRTGSSCRFHGSRRLLGFEVFTTHRSILSSGLRNSTVRYGVNSGAYQVTSSVLINSSGYVFDQINYGRYTDFAFTAINSQTPFYLIAGEPLR